MEHSWLAVFAGLVCVLASGCASPDLSELPDDVRDVVIDLRHEGLAAVALEVESDPPTAAALEEEGVHLERLLRDVLEEAEVAVVDSAAALLRVRATAREEPEAEGLTVQFDLRQGEAERTLRVRSYPLAQHPLVVGAEVLGLGALAIAVALAAGFALGAALALLLWAAGEAS
jgi:hypothetical protein